MWIFPEKGKDVFLGGQGWSLYLGWTASWSGKMSEVQRKNGGTVSNHLSASKQPAYL